MNARLFSLFAFVSILATGAWAAPASTPASSDAPTQLFSRNDSSAQIALANEFETLFVSLNASLMGTIVELVDYDTQTSVMMLKQNMTVTSLNSSLSDMGTSIEEHVNATSALESSAGQYDAYDMLDVHPKRAKLFSDLREFFVLLGDALTVGGRTQLSVPFGGIDNGLSSLLTTVEGIISGTVSLLNETLNPLSISLVQLGHPVFNQTLSQLESSD